MSPPRSDLSYELSDDRGSCFPGSTARAHIITVFWQERRVTSGEVSGDGEAELQACIDAFLARTLAQMT